MNGVIALGRHAGPFLPAPIHVVHVDPAEVLGDLGAMHDLLSHQLAVQQPLLVIYPATLGDAPARAISTVRAALDGAPLLWHATGLPPLAADVLVTLAAALHEPLGDAAVVAAALPLLEQQIVHLAWVPSVTGLRAPAPTVWQHARSMAPGGSWLVSSWPEPGIHRLGSGDLPALPSPAQEVGVVVADLDGDLTWITPTVMAHMPAAVGVQVEPPADSAAWWGCRRVTQVVVYPRSVEQLARALRGHLDPGPCGWCRRTVGSRICPWCELPRNGLTRLVEAEQPGVMNELFNDVREVGAR
ncbi:hypothetical protein BH23ACT9_BH23ACT9_10750 [soil metagenome]